MQTRFSLAALLVALLLTAPAALAQDLSSPEACAAVADASDTLPADFAERCGPLSTRAPQVATPAPDTRIPVMSAKGGSSCSSGTWTTATSLNTARSRPGAAYHTATGKFYVAGGEGSGGNRDIPIEEYDPVANTWTDRSLLNTGVSNTGVASWGDYLYVPGGWNGATAQSTMQRFDPVANTVTNMTAMPGANYANGVGALGGKIYVMGGDGNATTNYIYDVGTDSWATGAPLPVGTAYPAVTTDGTYLYVIGGGSSSDFADVQRYDPVGDSWMTMTSLTTGRGGPGAFYDGTDLFVVGGGWFSYFTSTEYGDGASWTPGPAMSVGARTIGAAYGNGMGMKAGGWAGAYLDAVETISCAPAAPSFDIAINTHGTAARGGSVFFRGPVTNTGGAAGFVYVYFTVDVPGVGTYKTNLGGIMLAAGQTFQYKNFPKSKNYVPLPLNAPGGTYTVTVYAASDNAGTVVYDTDSFQFTLPPLATVASLPGEMSLEAVEPGAAPNPFRDATTFTYALVEDAPVDLRVYDVTGREVSALVSGTQSAGTHTATLRAGDLPGGVYVWRLAIGGEVSTGRITLAR